MNRGSWLRGLALGLLFVVLGLSLITARAVQDGEEHMKQSDAAFNRGDLLESLLHARSAAVMYAPGAPHVRRAYDRMIAIAVGAEAAGQRRTAEAAWRAVRGSALETRHLWIPHAADLARANAELARVNVGATPPVDAGDPKVALERARLELARDDAPSTPWLVALVLGFVSVLAGLALVGLRGVTSQGQIVLGRAKLGLLLSTLGALAWTLAVWRA